MYYDFFGLKQPPFRITPDTSMFYPGGDRGSILEALVYAILNGEGIVKVVGEVGSGKTMLCRMLEQELPGKVEIVYIANPSLSPENILHAIAYDLGLNIDSGTSRLDVMNSLQEYLLNKHANGEQVVVFIEEAQSMPIATLEEIRLLSNLETRKNKLLQIVLFGQPELDEMLTRREIRQLKERITYSFQLNPFSSDVIRDYLNSRLRACGYRAGDLFNPAAVSSIEQFSNGLLRRINILADKAMLAAYAGSDAQIGPEHVRQAARDSEFTHNPLLRFWQPALAGLALLLVMVVLWQFTTPSPDASPGIETTPAAGTYGSTVPAAPENKIGTTAQAPADRPINAAALEPRDSTTGSPVPVAAMQQPRKRLDPDLHEQPRVTASSQTLGIEPAAAGQAGQPAAMDAIKSQLMGVDESLMPASEALQGYTDLELQLLHEQLEKLPPEVSYQDNMSQTSDTCRLCWSIIYRPLTRPRRL